MHVKQMSASVLLSPQNFMGLYSRQRAEQQHTCIIAAALTSLYQSTKASYTSATAEYLVFVPAVLIFSVISSELIFRAGGCSAALAVIGPLTLVILASPQCR